MHAQRWHDHGRRERTKQAIRRVLKKAALITRRLSCCLCMLVRQTTTTSPGAHGLTVRRCTKNGVPSPTIMTPQLKKLPAVRRAPAATALPHSLTWLRASPWTPRNAIKKRPVQFSRCSLNEGVTLEQVAAQEMKNVKQMEDAGFKGLAIAYHVPYMGFNKAPDFDFVMNYYWYSFDARAHAAQNYGAFAAEIQKVRKRWKS